MKTYQNFQFNYRRLLLLLVLFSPLALSANDDCQDLVREARKLARAIEKARSKVETAKSAVAEAQAVRDRAQAALDEFDHPDDPAEHGSDTERRRQKLTRALEKAEEALLEAKAHHYDMLQKLIDELEALKRKLDEADEQCRDELEEADQDMHLADLRKLQDLQDELDELRDKHNLETRAGEPEEPENTKKEQEDLVDAELKALLKAIIDAIREAHEDAEAIRSALRKKKQEIRNDWDDGFWDTPLGKELKKRLEEALQEIIDDPTGALPDFADEPQEEGTTEEEPQEDGATEDESPEDPDEDDDLKSIVPDESKRFGLGFSFGLNGDLSDTWCPKVPVSGSTPSNTDLITVITQTNQGSTSGSTDLSTSHPIAVEADVKDPSAQPIPCLEQWTIRPTHGAFVEGYLNDRWAARIGIRRWSAHSQVPVIPGENNAEVSPSPSWTAALDGFELQTGLVHYIGRGRIRPMLGGQAVYQQLSGSMYYDGVVEQPAYPLKKDRWGAQALGGFEIRVFRDLGIALLGQWDQYFGQKMSSGTPGVQLQFIWYP
ncbi:coiled-coil domain-containing protein [Flavilitoribacter nigricans]|uniref:Outer membrane protein beta-barrel domain-containing protein n=1 Tax=Flavilitoribacter nigricans (strain ATCC 23147 / DSM 23189 / NBRC 102662 / NCIMB 1420 / SS-2) TaxID=1122177 RepID=A0A2D0N6Y3_FLAN2|nr:hypothetical protein [Flavilitoribacter nigricans]PHN04158.1 hypothetical protein CRP01_23470 [Flavilitoribacter nigricans DSM 23189 = NBRC 102662]